MRESNCKCNTAKVPSYYFDMSTCQNWNIFSCIYRKLAFCITYPTDLHFVRPQNRFVCLPAVCYFSGCCQIYRLLSQKHRHHHRYQHRLLILMQILGINQIALANPGQPPLPLRGDFARQHHLQRPLHRLLTALRAGNVWGTRAGHEREDRSTATCCRLILQKSATLPLPNSN